MANSMPKTDSTEDAQSPVHAPILTDNNDVEHQSKSLERRIQSHQKLLEKWTQESHPQKWASTQFNLGCILREKIRGFHGGGDNDDAVECFRLALQVWTRESNPEYWATTQYYMGLALSNRISGDRRENIDSAIECYRLALQVRTRESNPEDWASTQNNMGLALRTRISGDRRENIDSAIECYRLALQVWTRESNPEYWASTQNNMGLALNDRISGDRRENIDSAIECYRLALQVRTRESNPEDWATTQHGMGNAYLSRTAGEGNTNLSNAKLSIENFFEVISLEMDPLSFLRGCHSHTKLYLRIGSVREIIASCHQGLQAVDYAKSLSSAGLVHSRHLNEEYAGFANNLMSLHFHEGQYERVVEVFDRNKASLLLSLISEWDKSESKLSEGDRRKLEESKSRYRTLKYEMDLKSEKGEEYEETMEEFRRVKASIDRLVKLDDLEEGQDVLGVSCREMVEFVKKKNVLGIVFFCAGEYKRLRKGDSSKSLHAICMWNGELSGHLASEELKHVRSYKTAKMFSEGGPLQSEGESREEWNERLKDEKEFLEKVGRFVSSMLDDLKDKNPGCKLPSRLVIVPHHILSKVPFCAVPVRTKCDGYSGTDPRFLGDVFREGIWMIPSMSIGVRIDRKKARKRKRKLEECKVVSATCPSVELREQYDKTVREKIGRRSRHHVHIEDPHPPRKKIKMSGDLRDCDILHLTCHGVFSGEDIMSARWNPSKVLSGSTLSFGLPEKDKELKKLNMVDIWELNLKECSLVNVVACSGGAVNTLSESDENLSIGTGFLVGGARNVICCVWPVEEIVAAMMMDRLCKNMCRGDEENGVWKIGEHLLEAQRWMRELTDEEILDELDEFDPKGATSGIARNNFYYWGSFMIIGPPD